MKHGPLLFLGLLVTVGLSWWALLIGPHLQFGDQPMILIEETGLEYPPARSGEALQGAEVYRANGCYYCHSQQVRSTKDGSDIARGWGKRRTVARDYLRDRPVMIGQSRFGPDLANLGARESDPQKLLLKLYNPRIVMPESTMPRYPYLFEVRKLAAGASPSSEALLLPAMFAPGPDLEVVPKPGARALVAYLLSLKSETAFYEVFPTPPPKPATNVGDAAGGTNAVDAAGSTNAVPTSNADTNAPPTS